MTNPVDDETALEEVLAWLERPPAPGTPEDARFGAMLRQVLAASLPEDDEDPETGTALPLAADLRHRLESLSLRRSAANPFGENPDGIGPTLGMDVGRS